MKPNENSNAFMVPAGLHDAICYGVVHIGTQKSEYQGKPKLRNTVYIMYELPSVTHEFNEDKGEEPAVVSKKFTYTYSERGNLLDWINTWSNGKVSKKNINDFDIEKLVGIGCKLQIIEDEGSNGSYSYPKGIISLTEKEKETLNKGALYNPIQVYSVDEHDQEKFDKLPNWLQNKVKESQEYKKLGISEENSDIPDDMKPSEDEDAAF